MSRHIADLEVIDFLVLEPTRKTCAAKLDWHASDDQRATAPRSSMRGANRSISAYALLNRPDEAPQNNIPSSSGAVRAPVGDSVRDAIAPYSDFPRKFRYLLAGSGGGDGPDVEPSFVDAARFARNFWSFETCDRVRTFVRPVRAADMAPLAGMVMRGPGPNLQQRARSSEKVSGFPVPDHVDHLPMLIMPSSQLGGPVARSTPDQAPISTGPR